MRGRGQYVSSPHWPSMQTDGIASCRNRACKRLFSGLQFFFLGVLGEYISAIHSQVRKRPLVIERERINFAPPSPAQPQSNSHSSNSPSSSCLNRDAG